MSKILAPALPFQTGIPGGIHDGKMIEIKGRIPYGAERFEINLMAGYDQSSDRVLHLSIRFDQHCVVRNHKQYDQWGPEERQGPFPFSFGRDFTMLIAAERTQYRIAVNNQHCWNFAHRLPMNRVNSIAMRGFFEVFQVEFIGRPNPIAINNQHRWDFGHRLPTGQVKSIIVSGFFDIYIDNIDRPNLRTQTVPTVQRGRTRLPPVYNPNIPYAYPIYDGLEPGMMIHINGRPSSNPHKFTINLQRGAAQHPPPDVAFHFDPRFFNRSVVRNTRRNGAWAAEETYISHFPFQPGISFELVIRVEADRFSVSINGRHFTDFQHRLRPLEMFDTLYIENDVSISSIRFS